jgi:hypothetical protein
VLGHQRHAHFDALRIASRYLEHAGFVAIVAGIAFGIGDAVPGLDADIGRAGFGPDAEFGGVGEGDVELRTGLGAVGQRVGMDRVPDQRVFREQFVAKGDYAVLYRRGALVDGDLAVWADCLELAGFVIGERDAGRLGRPGG